MYIVYILNIIQIMAMWYNCNFLHYIDCIINNYIIYININYKYNCDYYNYEKINNKT
jgi:hypothetical protein